MESMLLPVDVDVVGDVVQLGLLAMYDVVGFADGLVWTEEELPFVANMVDRLGCRLWNGTRLVRLPLSGLLLCFILGAVERPHSFLHLKANSAHASE